MSHVARDPFACCPCACIAMPLWVSRDPALVAVRGVGRAHGTPRVRRAVVRLAALHPGGGMQ